MTEERLAYRIEDVVKIIRLSRVSIYKLIADGKLRTVKVGGCRLVPASALRDLLENIPTSEPTKGPTKLAAVERRK